MGLTVVKKGLGVLISCLILLVFFLPFYWVILTSLKTVGQIFSVPLTFWVDNPQWENYVSVFEAIPFWPMVRNSLIVTGGILFCQAFTVIPAAYAFARFQFRGAKLLFGLTLSTMMIPGQLIFLPLFLMFSKMGLVNSYLSLIIPFGTSAFGIFMLRQTFKQVPLELIEAAQMDKASELKILLKVMLPIAVPTLATLFMFVFISNWNDYFWPFVLTTNQAVRTLAVGIGSLGQTESRILYHVVLAGNVILMAPVILVFLFAQKRIIQAFTYLGDK